MEQIIIAPDQGWINRIARMWLRGDTLSVEITGQKMDGSLTDLDRLQAIIDSSQLAADNTADLQCLGIIFGKVFVNLTPDYDWWIVKDAYGEDPCIRYKETSLLVFPQTILSKRIEDGEKPDVQAIYHGLCAQLEDIRRQHYAITEHAC